jgi:uncharacterized membrane protein YcgQ (UPF0703/DUF1980 family)
MEMPVYLFTGFLEAGKTKCIQETLEDSRFNTGEPLLVICCEEGVEELDPSSFASPNVAIEFVDDPEDLTTELMTALEEKHRPQMIIVEYNGMWMLDLFYTRMPENWFVHQEMLFIDETTVKTYNANMRTLMVDKLQSCEMVIFNRVPEGRDVMELHQLVRTVSRRATIAYETAEGELEYDEIEDPLPFDVNAPVVQIADNDYAIFYRDLAEEMPEWQGKTVKFKGMVARDKHLGKTALVIGRHVMTCCADDITFSGLVCNFDRDVSFKTDEWIMVTARIRIQSHALYGSEGPVLYATDVAATSEPKQPVATFY